VSRVRTAAVRPQAGVPTLRVGKGERATPLTGERHARRTQVWRFATAARWPSLSGLSVAPGCTLS
jgi:hypothetical protein